MTDRPLTDRDRDGLGRPRSARPRDALGRPLPRDRPGAQLDEPDYSALTSAGALAMAQELLDSGRPFEAHEVFEAMWRRAPTQRRQLWQGLAQLAVAITHLLRGNAAGADRILRRARANLLPYGGGADPGADPEVDVRSVLAWIDGLLAQVGSGTTVGDASLQVQPPSLRIRRTDDGA